MWQAKTCEAKGFDFKPRTFSHPLCLTQPYKQLEGQRHQRNFLLVLRPIINATCPRRKRESSSFAGPCAKSLAPRKNFLETDGSCIYHRAVSKQLVGVLVFCGHLICCVPSQGSEGFLFQLIFIYVSEVCVVWGLVHWMFFLDYVAISFRMFLLCYCLEFSRVWIAMYFFRALSQGSAGM